MYVYVCVCVCVKKRTPEPTHLRGAVCLQIVNVDSVAAELEGENVCKAAKLHLLLCARVKDNALGRGVERKLPLLEDRVRDALDLESWREDLRDIMRHLVDVPQHALQLAQFFNLPQVRAECRHKGLAFFLQIEDLLWNKLIEAHLLLQTVHR